MPRSDRSRRQQLQQAVTRQNTTNASVQRMPQTEESEATSKEKKAFADDLQQESTSCPVLLLCPADFDGPSLADLDSFDRQAGHQQAMDDLDLARQAMDSAVTGLGRLTELKSYSAPPVLVGMVMEAVCIIHGREPDWPTAKTLMATTPLADWLIAYEKINISDTMLATLKQYTGMTDFAPERVRRVSEAAASLCTWCRAMEVYATKSAHASKYVDESTRRGIAEDRLQATTHVKSEVNSQWWKRHIEALSASELSDLLSRLRDHQAAAEARGLSLADLEVMNAICVLHGRPPSIAEAHVILAAPGAIEQIKTFDKESVCAGVAAVEALYQHTRVPRHMPEEVGKSYVAINALWMWVQAMEACGIASTGWSPPPASTLWARKGAATAYGGRLGKIDKEPWKGMVRVQFTDGNIPALSGYVKVDMLLDMETKPEDRAEVICVAKPQKC